MRIHLSTKSKMQRGRLRWTTENGREVGAVGWTLMALWIGRRSRAAKFCVDLVNFTFARSMMLFNQSGWNGVVL
jgi:hypothetical protein